MDGDYPTGRRAVSPYTDCRGITPAANMASTVEDLARYAMLHLRDGQRRGKQVLRGSSLPRNAASTLAEP